MLYELIINNSNENLFSPDIYEFLFNLNDHKVPEKYITKMIIIHLLKFILIFMLMKKYTRLSLI